MNCAICDHLYIQGEVIDTMTFFLNGKHTPLTNVLICPECGYVWLSPKISADELDIYYSAQGRIATETIAYKEQAAFIKKFTKPIINMKAAV